MPDFLNGLFFSEILADNAGGGAIDVNGQGGTNKQDEFVEIQNRTGETIDLDGYQIWSEKNGLLHSFGTGDQIGPSGTATVVGSYTNPPAGFFGANGSNNSASGNGGFLEDGEAAKNDTIFLVDPDGNYIQLSYGQPPQPPTSLPSGFPTGGTLQGSGESLNSGAPNGTSVLRDADGNLVEGAPNPGTSGTVCFTSGTMIKTDLSDVAVDALAPGMRICSMDHGHVPLRAIRKAPIGRAVLNWNPDVRPIVIPAGVLGNPITLRLSPAHRLLIGGTLVDLLFATHEVLVPAHQLVGHAGIHRDMRDEPVTYFHLLFDTHEIVQSNGCWSESLFLGDVAHAAIEASSGWQTDASVDLSAMAHETTARPVLKGYETAALAGSLVQVMPEETAAA
ncbi:MAG: Hint domain-containing protein [Pseudomonadota bacterium]